MENFKVWIISLCGAGIISSLFKILVSNSNVKKSVNIFLSMFVFLYTIIPIENVISDLKIDTIENYDAPDYTEIYKSGYETIIIKTIENVCASNGVTILSVNIDSYIDENQYLVVNKIELELNTDEKNQIIQKELREKSGIEVIFIWILSKEFN